MLKIAVAVVALLFYSPLLLKHLLVGTAPRIDWEAGRQFEDAADGTQMKGTDMKDANFRLAVAPFRINVTQTEKDDLAARLSLPSRPTKPLFPPGSNKEWKYGIPHFVVEDVLSHWKNSYDWSAQEAKLNENLFSTTIDGLRVVFKHMTPKAGAGAGARGSASEPPTTSAKRQPVLLLHGWPGSIVEFNVFSQLLLEDGHAVVIPCLPGYGWSEVPQAAGFGIQEAAISFLKLMRGLGYGDGYIVQGGDWGAMIAEHMVQIAPQEAAAIHLNFAVVALPDTLWTVAKVYLFGTAQDKKRLADAQDLRAAWDVMGYLHEQATRPHTLGAAISTTPQGMMMWIAEKFQGWSDPSTELKAKFSLDDLITNVLIYWWSDSFTTAARLYKESLSESKDAMNVVLRNVNVPAGVALFPFELFPPPVAYVEDKFKHLLHLSAESKGGHFAALDEPRALHASFVAFRTKLNAACASQDCPECCMSQ